MFSNIAGRADGFQTGIGHGNTKADPPEKRYIDDIIPDIGCLFRSKISPPQDVVKYLSFVPDPLMDLGNSQICGTVVDNPGFSARQEHHVDPVSHENFQAMAVSYIELFALQPRIVDNDPAIGHDPVHVEDQELYPADPR